MRYLYRQNQNGSGIVEAFLIIVVIGILGFTGYFVWHSQKSATTTLNETLKATNSSLSAKTPAAKSAAPKLLTASMDAAVGKDISFTYPETWSLTKGAVQKSPYLDQKVTVKSPSGSLSLVYEASDGGLGGACSPADSGTISSLRIEPIAQFDKASYVETTFTSGMNNGKTTFAGIMDKDSLGNAKQGGSYCGLYLADVITMMNNAGNVLNLTAHVDFADANVSTSATAFQRALGSSEYTQAKSILLSTAVK